MEIIIIAAKAANNVIGKDGKIPWHLHEDLKRFKRLTVNQTVIMGRRTYESLGKALPNRINIVVSHKLSNSEVPDCIMVTNLRAAIRIATCTAEMQMEVSAKSECLMPFPVHLPNLVFLIGGAGIYEEGMQYADKLYITDIEESVDGDTVFPKINGDDWQLTSSVRRPPVNGINYNYRIYNRIK